MSRESKLYIANPNRREDWWQCSYCGYKDSLEREVNCWQCGRGEMIYFGPKDGKFRPRPETVLEREAEDIAKRILVDCGLSLEIGRVDATRAIIEAALQRVARTKIN